MDIQLDGLVNELSDGLEEKFVGVNLIGYYQETGGIIVIEINADEPEDIGMKTELLTVAESFLDDYDYAVIFRLKSPSGEEFTLNADSEETTIS